MKRKVLIVLAVLALIGLYARGTFDHLLYNVGLNAHECARNGFGATFCGHELDEYRAKIERVKQEGEAARPRSRKKAHAVKTKRRPKRRESRKPPKRPLP